MERIGSWISTLTLLATSANCLCHGTTLHLHSPPLVCFPRAAAINYVPGFLLIGPSCKISREACNKEKALYITLYHSKPSVFAARAKFPEVFPLSMD